MPGVCTHTDTEGKQRKARFRNILEKNTIFNEHPVSALDSFQIIQAKGTQNVYH